VVGYSVAARPEHGERPVWYGGGRLARDLTLPRLRHGWSDTPAAAEAAAAEWTAAKLGRRAGKAGREADVPAPEQWTRCNEDLLALQERLRAVPLGAADTWADVARQAAGALAAYSKATEPVPGDLAAASDALAASARTYTAPATRSPEPGGVIGDMAMLLACAGRAGSAGVMQALLMRRLLGLAQAIYEAEDARANARAARLIATDTRARLARVRDALPTPAGGPVHHDGQAADSAAEGALGERARKARELADLASPGPITEAVRGAGEGPAPEARPGPRPGSGTERGRDR
jgi:hypothetical protein